MSAYIVSDNHHSTDAYKHQYINAEAPTQESSGPRDLGDNTTWSIDELKSSPAKYEVVEYGGYNND